MENKNDQDSISEPLENFTPEEPLQTPPAPRPANPPATENNLQSNRPPGGDNYQAARFQPLPPNDPAPILPASSIPSGQPASAPPPNPTPPVPQAVSTLPPANNFKRKIILLAGSLLIMAGLLGMVIYALVSKNDQPTAEKTEQKISVPEDWKAIDTKLGFKVKAPPGWTAGSNADSDVAGLSSECVTLSDTSKTGINAGNINDAGPAEAPVFVSACAVKLKGAATRQEFEKKISVVDKEQAEVLKAFGVDASQIKITKKTVSINEREWFVLNTAMPGQLSSDYYYWAGDHMVLLGVIEFSDDRAKLEKLTQDYLMPMSASAEIQ